jgi:hypothetical protein
MRGNLSYYLRNKFGNFKWTRNSHIAIILLSLVGKASSVAHENSILWRMEGAPQKRRHKNKLSVAHLAVRHRIKVFVAHLGRCATEISSSVAHVI